MNEEPENEIIEPEIVEPETKVERRRPSAPVTVDDLAALKAEGHEIIEARVQILESLRKASIRSTKPQDWLLFKAENRITAYLGDVGCQRVRPLWGLDISPIGGFERIASDDGEFAYSIRADGFCSVTGRAVKAIEGLRYSTDDFVQGLSPIVKEMRVRQAATANRDGNIVRELTGLNSVPIEELKAAGLNTDLCAYGKGFGSKAERLGAQVQQRPPSEEGGFEIPAPLCKVCKNMMKYVPAGKRKSDGAPYEAFWACGVREHKSSVKDAEWVKKVEQDFREKHTELDREPGAEG